MTTRRGNAGKRERANRYSILILSVRIHTAKIDRRTASGSTTFSLIVRRLFSNPVAGVAAGRGFRE